MSKKPSGHDKRQKRALREKTNLKLSNAMKNFVISNEVDANKEVQENLLSASNLKEGDYESKSCAKNILEDAEIFSKVNEERIALDIKTDNVEESISLDSSENLYTDSAIGEIISMSIAECKVADTNIIISSVCNVTSILKENSILDDPALWPDQAFFKNILLNLKLNKTRIFLRVLVNSLEKMRTCVVKQIFSARKRMAKL